jgi:DNA-binding response OmpR family regulator
MQKDFSNLTILYVEDEELIRQNAVEYLDRVFKNVLEAKNGIEAYKVYKAKKPDIIITDINMPHLSGLSLAKKIREHDKQTPIIIATAHTQTEYLIAAVELQLIKYIVKPITSKKLNEALTLAYNHLALNNIIDLDKITTYDTLNQTLFIENRPIKLTKNELSLLDLLTKNHQRAVTYKEIENLIWYEEGMSMDALRTLVRALRKKMNGDFIENVSSIGYRCSIHR